MSHHNLERKQKDGQNQRRPSMNSPSSPSSPSRNDPQFSSSSSLVSSATKYTRLSPRLHTTGDESQLEQLRVRSSASSESEIFEDADDGEDERVFVDDDSRSRAFPGKSNLLFKGINAEFFVFLFICFSPRYT